MQRAIGLNVNIFMSGIIMSARRPEQNKKIFLNLLEKSQIKIDFLSHFFALARDAISIDKSVALAGQIQKENGSKRSIPAGFIAIQPHLETFEGLGNSKQQKIKVAGFTLLLERLNTTCEAYGVNSKDASLADKIILHSLSHESDVAVIAKNLGATSQNGPLKQELSSIGKQAMHSVFARAELVPAAGLFYRKGAIETHPQLKNAIKSEITHQKQQQQQVYGICAMSLVEMGLRFKIARNGFSSKKAVATADNEHDAAAKAEKFNAILQPLTGLTCKVNKGFFGYSIEVPLDERMQGVLNEMHRISPAMLDEDKSTSHQGRFFSTKRASQVRTTAMDVGPPPDLKNPPMRSF